MSTLLKIDKVTKNYHLHKALSEININIPKGSIYGLLGPNGAGKTSLIRIINQITAPDSGTVYYNNEVLSNKHTRFIGYLPEERGLYKKEKVIDQILYFASLKGLSSNDAKAKTDYWLKKFDLLTWKNKKTEELSKGMAQKVQFIITVIHNPELLILDEPFTGFDPINAEILKEEIKNFKNNGATILYSTHRMESVEEICDHICMINKSKLVLDGSIHQILNDHKSNTYEICYNGIWPDDIPTISIETLQQKNRAISNLPQNLTLNSFIPKIINNIELISIQEKLPTIKDIFINTVNQ